jgi:hypothetical protein
MKEKVIMNNLKFAALLPSIFRCCIGIFSFVTVLQASAAEVELLPLPSTTNSSLSRVVTDNKGHVYLSWVTQADEMLSLNYSKMHDGAWSTPEVISQGDNWFNNWADFPSLLVNENNMTAHWLGMNAKNNGYRVLASFYNAENRRWGNGIIIRNESISTYDGIRTESGFATMLPMSQDRTFITWLDELETAGGTMSLRAGIFDKAGKTLNEWELDSKVCDCCQTSAAMSSTGPIVVYRDRSDEEIRDTYITRYVNGKWTQPTTVHNDGWKIGGCPVNGPSISAQGDYVAVSWFTAKDNIPKVQLAFSTDNGESFSSPVRVASQTTNGRLSTTFLENGNLAVSWMDVDGRDAKVMLSLYSVAGKLLDTTHVANTSASRRSGFPVIDSVANDVYITWTNTKEAQVRVARVSNANGKFLSSR